MRCSGFLGCLTVAGELRAVLASGAYPPGQLLPSEPELAATHAVSRVTIRKALGRLEAEGLLDSRQGFGWYVIAVPLRQSLGFDPDAARAALDGAGWVVSGDGRAKDGEPLELDLLVSPSPTHGPTGSRTAAEAIASELEAVGIGVTIKDVDSAVYYDEQQAGNWDLSFLETFGSPYDPAATMVSFLTTGAGGVPLWVSPELDKLVDAAVFSTDDAERAVAYQKVFDYLGTEAAFVPIVHPPRFWAVGPAVSGFDVPVTEYDMDLHAVTVSR